MPRRTLQEDEPPVVLCMQVQQGFSFSEVNDILQNNSKTTEILPK